MDFIEPEHLSQLRDTLRRFVEQEMPRPLAAKWDRENHFPRDVFAKLAEIGVMGLTIDEAHGGVGRDIAATMMVIEELSRRSLAVSVPYIMAACYGGMNIAEFGTEAQKASILPAIARGEMLVAYGLTEPDAGADLASVRTRVERRGDRLILNGEKRFCSGANIADYIYVLARSGDTGDRHRNLSFVLVPPSAPGVEVTIIDAMGMKGAATTDVLFTDVEVPIDNLVGGEPAWNQGWPMLVGTGLDVEKLEVAAIGIGVAQAALDDAWTYSVQRKQFGKLISSYQSIQHKLASMETQLHGARLALSHAAWLADKHLPCRQQTSMAKLLATETAKYVALEAQTIMGAYGYVREVDTERYVREALLLPIIGGSSAIQHNNIYKQMQATRC